MSSHSDLPVSSLSDTPCGTPSHDPQTCPKMRKIGQNRCKKRGDVLVLLQDKNYRHTVTINTLPDNVLLDIFDFCRISHHHSLFRPVWEWHRLVHVSRRWRQIIFASPRRLDLQVLCTHRTPVRENLGFWPAFPIVIDDTLHNDLTPHEEDNIIAALEHPDRVRRVQLRATGSQLGKVAAMMQDSFPVLTHLRLSSKDENVPVLDDGFMGGSAPCLQEINLDGVPIPSLPALISSATCLVSLRLCNIPKTGLVSPEVMVTCLAGLAQFRDLRIEFRSPTPRRLDQRRLAALQTLPRVVLSALTSLTFRGVCEYLEDLVAQIETPRLGSIDIRFFNQLVDFQLSQLPKFIKRSENSELTRFGQAEVTFGSHWVSFSLRHESHSHRRPITTSISCEGISWQVSHISQVANQFSAMLSDVAHLAITQVERNCQQEGMDDTEWLQLLRPFTAVTMLRVSRELTGFVALALEDITKDIVAEVMPALDLLCLVGQPVSSSSVEKFVAARRASGRPVTVVNDPWQFYRRVHPSN